MYIPLSVLVPIATDVLISLGFSLISSHIVLKMEKHQHMRDENSHCCMKAIILRLKYFGKKPKNISFAVTYSWRRFKEKKFHANSMFVLRRQGYIM